MRLLTRTEFRNAVFARDHDSCVICGATGVPLDAHHIMERRLWADGGYYIDNGATLCGIHHIEAEKTALTCEEIRSKAGISTVLLPEHMYPDQRYDKWGNPIQKNGTRLRGELFYDESVQKILQSVLGSFTEYVKYPRTWHLPWSPGATEDDRVLKDVSQFIGRRVIVTAKMDGENTSLYQNYLHARAVDGASDDTQSWVRNMHAKIGWQISPGWRVCGENLYAKHTIKYQGLPSWFQMFSIWDEKNYCLPWEETREWAALLELKLVPVMYAGIFDQKTIRALESPTWNGNELEGYVIRIAEGFHYKDFAKSVAKYVRAGFQVGSHGRSHHRTFELNQLAPKSPTTLAEPVDEAAVVLVRAEAREVGLPKL